MPTSNKTPRGPLLTGVAALLLIALAARLLIIHGGRWGARGSTLTTTATPAGGLPAGWTTTPLGSGNAAGIAVAPSDPRTIYACLHGRQGLVLSVTHDAGGSWTSTTVPLQGGYCAVDVAPTNPDDVVLPVDLGRSLDGGHDWQPLPQTGMNLSAMGWVDASLYVAMTPVQPLPGIGGPQTPTIYVSHNGSAFTNLDPHGTLGGISLNGVGINIVTGHGSTILIASTSSGLLSIDGGQTWSTVKFEDAGGPVHLLSTSPDGQTLVGDDVISHDWGRTWQALSAALLALVSPNSLHMTPDGTLCASIADGVTSIQPGVANAQSYLYILPPGATQWTADLQLPKGIIPYTVTWDVSGHPARLWAAFGSDESQGSSYSIVSHPL
jgi:hypothetical protein